MKPLTVREVRKILRAELINGSEDFRITQAVHYSDKDIINKNTMIFISKGDEVHWQRLNSIGNVLAITDKPQEELKRKLPNLTILRVKNAQRAFWDFTAYYRNLFDVPVVALTGTCGKTTTKEMIAHILRGDMEIQISESSKNEPRQSLTYLTGIEEKTKAAVFELGLGNSGNISHQCLVYKPTIGIITNIGVHHLDGCKNLEGYIRAKGEIVSGIAKDGTLIINSDDENTKKISLKAFKGKVISFGLGEKADFRASNIQYRKNGMSFSLNIGNGSYGVFVPGFGEHQVYNALAAIAAAREIGVSIQKSIIRLRTFKNMTRHLEFSTGIGGSTIIDDTWTNNPTSIEAALNVLDEIGKGKRVIVVLGDIKRLGQFEKKYHREIGNMVAKRDIHTLITIGSKAEEIARQAKRDQTKANVHIFKDVRGIMDILKPELNQETILLIKGPMSSRSMIEFAQQLKDIE
ncbi:UDP-N-acetylmuramoyl-tripeptide--D-alanyl-D-alanine ligase [Lysinibacillus sp. 54212]|uniref:UDP-N-acetylmuramoyl-tripeptide--D-alanyl-D- alanine ligase n=1 Tax=Lysinibacillus sp. 54212 TaxID=3119829 RepID=UPI002FCA9CC7